MNTKKPDRQPDGEFRIQRNGIWEYVPYFVETEEWNAKPQLTDRDVVELAATIWRNKYGVDLDTRPHVTPGGHAIYEDERLTAPLTYYREHMTDFSSLGNIGAALERVIDGMNDGWDVGVIPSSWRPIPRLTDCPIVISNYERYTRDELQTIVQRHQDEVLQSGHPRPVGYVILRPSNKQTNKQ